MADEGFRELHRDLARAVPSMSLDKLAYMAITINDALIEAYLEGHSWESVLGHLSQGNQDRTRAGCASIWQIPEEEVRFRHVIVPGPGHLGLASGIGPATMTNLFSAIEKAGLMDVRWEEWASRLYSRIDRERRLEARKNVAKEGFTGDCYHLLGQPLWWVVARKSGVV